MSNSCPTSVPGDPPLPRTQLTDTYCLAHTADIHFQECCPNHTVFPYNGTTLSEYSTPGCYQWCYVPGLNSEAAWEQTYHCIRNAADAAGDDTGILLCDDTANTAVSTGTDIPEPTSTSTSSIPDPTQRCINITMPYGLSTQPTTGVCALPNPDLIPTGANYSAPSNATLDVLARCCDWSPRRWGVGHCWEYCYLPRGNNFRGDGNLTAEQAVGSFRACVEELQGQNDVTGELLCAWDGGPMDLGTFNSSVTKWVLKDAAVRPAVGSLASLYLALTLWTLL